MKSMEERMEAAKKILFGKAILLITKPIKSLENRVVEGCCTGYQIGIDNLSYRGVWVSTIEDIQLVVDGKEVEKEKIYLSLAGKLYPAYTLQGHTEVFWGIEDEAYLWINQPGGLAKGEHSVEVAITKRQDFGHSYGEGTDGYDTATEFTCPEIIRDSNVLSV